MEYQLEKEIGRGGMGCVYQGRDPQGRLVAIKMMSNEVTCYPEYRALFDSEVETLRRMNHKSVVRVVGNPFGDSKGNLYLPMEFVHGETIEQYVRRHGPFNESEAVEIMAKILDAMQYVHDRRCIHRDIKPSNIMLRTDKSICIIDFGIAKDSKIGSSGKTVGRIIGTDGYMSPEQATGLNIDLRTDIYSLGCVFYFMLTGKHAITKQSNDYKTVQAIISMEIPRPSLMVQEISPEIENALMKSVNKNMTLRFQTARDFRNALLNKSDNNQNIPRITVGKEYDNDIQFPNEYVSKHHLIIRGTDRCEVFSECIDYEIIIEDKSTNGTGVNGLRLHHNTANIRCRSFRGGQMFFQVMNLAGKDVSTATQGESDFIVQLSGRPECVLDWNDIIRKLKAKGWGCQQPPPPPPSPSDESLGLFYMITSLLFPIVGWILWGVWKDDQPQKASIAAKWAWAGFILNIILTIIIPQIRSN